jgi:type III secretory pathway component EscS
LLHRIISAVLGVLTALAGLVVGLGYGATALMDLWDARTPLRSRLLVVFVTWSLALSAWYMAYQFLKFARFGRKNAPQGSAPSERREE